LGINKLETVGYQKRALKARRSTASPPALKALQSTASPPALKAPWSTASLPALKASWKLARDEITGQDTHKIPAPDGAAHLLSPDRRHSSRVRIMVRHVPVIASRANFQCAFSAG
jgi:hypothetical protein